MQVFHAPLTAVGRAASALPVRLRRSNQRLQIQTSPPGVIPVAPYTTQQNFKATRGSCML